MDIELIKFMKNQIEQKRPRLNELIQQVGDNFKVELLASDHSFIIQQYRKILMESWAEECINLLREKIASGEVGDDRMIEFLSIFRGLDAFKGTPVILRGNIYSLILSEYGIFNTKDFLKPRTEISSFLVFKLKTMEYQTKTEFQFQKDLVKVMQNSYNLFDKFVAALNLKDFIDEDCTRNDKCITLYEVAKNILNNNFNIDHFKDLKETASKLTNSAPKIKESIQNDVRAYVKEIIVKESQTGGKKILMIQRKILLSKDLIQSKVSNVDEVHIVCDILHIDSDLPESYHGKNVFVITNTIRLHNNAMWDLSGINASVKYTTNAGRYSNGDGKAGENGEAGESGGNCEIFCTQINYSARWTIKSNGGRGSDGQDGGNAADGEQGRDVKQEDFKLQGQQLTTSNFMSVLNQCGISTETGSRRVKIYDDNLEKDLIFNHNDKEKKIIMLIKGSSGKVGGLGGFGSFGGCGGFNGQININSNNHSIKIIAETGENGKNGEFGLNGKTGRNGRDGYMIITSDMKSPSYNGLNELSKYDFTISNSILSTSIFYAPLQRYWSVVKVRGINEPLPPIQNSLKVNISRLKYDEEIFYENLNVVVKNSNKNLNSIIRNLKIKELVDLKIDFKTFAAAIISNSYSIPNYDILQSYAKFYNFRPMKVETQIRDFLRDFIATSTITFTGDEVCEIKGKLVTSEDINSINQRYKELHVICDTLHINASLSEHLRGKDLMIVSNTVNIHKNVTINISGCDNFLAIKEQCPQKMCFENGGKCSIECSVINNPSLLKIISNGGNASNARNGIDAELDNFKIDGKTVEELPSQIKQTYSDENFVKHLVKESNSNYLLLVKGTDRISGYNGKGEKGGAPGYVVINAVQNTNTNEVEIELNNGMDDISKDGRDIVLYVTNGTKKYYGLTSRKKYELMTNNVDCENSVKYSSFYYHFKLARVLDDQIGPDSIELCNNLIWTLRNSFKEFDNIVQKLQLNNFTRDSENIDLMKLAESIESSRTDDFDACVAANSRNNQSNVTFTNDTGIANYSELRKCAWKFKKHNSTRYEADFQRLFKEYLSPVDVKTISNVTIIKKKIFHSSSLKNINIRKNIKEVHIMTDTLHIDSDLPEIFRGVNLAIISNYVTIHKPVIWDFSGLPATQLNLSKAGQNPDGSGKDGINGKPGNSGGNFFLHCKIIQNSSALTLISNGSDGLDGQDAGDGNDGRDGKNAQNSSFYKNNVEWKMYFDVGNKNQMYGAFGLTKAYHSYVVTDDGLNAEIYIDTGFSNDNGLMLVSGSAGEPGKKGGLPGYGGEKGYAGDIKIEIDDIEYSSNIKILKKDCKDGKTGKFGYNGVKGTDGRDLYKYDERNFKNPVIGGYGNLYKLIFTYNKNEDSLKKYHSLLNKDHYVKEGGWYGGITIDRVISTAKETKQRRETDLKDEQVKRSKALQSTQINVEKLRKEFSQYLDTQDVKIQKSINIRNALTLNEKSTFKRAMSQFFNTHKNYLQAYVFDAKNLDYSTKQQSTQKEAVKKSDIFVDSIIGMYQDYIKASEDKIDELTKKYRELKTEMETEEVQVQTEISVQVTFDDKKSGGKKKKNFPKVDGVVFYATALNMLIKGCNTYDLLKTVVNGYFMREQFEYLIKNIELYKIGVSKRNFIEKQVILDQTIEKFINEQGVDNKNEIVKKFYKLHTENNENWKEGLNDPKVLQNFVKFITQKHPSFIVNFFKNSTQGSRIEVDDIIKVCKEKQLLLFYLEINSKINKNFIQNIDSPEISYESNHSEFFRQIEYLQDTGELKIDSEPLKRHLIKCEENEKKEILEYFLLNCQNFTIGLPEAIFNILIYHANELEDITAILNEYSKKANEIINYDNSDDDDSDDEDIDDSNEEKIKDPYRNVLMLFEATSMVNLEPQEIFFRNLEKEKFEELLREFYNNEKIINVINKDISENGIKSKLYKCILAQKYGVKMVIFVQDINGEMKIIENHNYTNDLRYEYADKDKILDQTLNREKEENKTELFLLLRNHRYTTLKFKKENYHAFVSREKQNLVWETIVNILNGYNDSSDNSEIIKILTPLMKKYDLKNDTIFNIFEDDHLPIDNNTLIDIIMSYFPYYVIKYDKNGTKKYVIDDKLQKRLEDEKKKQDADVISYYKVFDDEKTREAVKIELLSIASTGGLSIVKAIAIHLYNYKNIQNLREFLLLLKTIRELLNEGQPLKYLLTFLILANDQDMWALEIAILKLENIFGVFETNLKQKWRKSGEKTKIKKVLELFLEKVTEIEENKEHLTKENITDIIENMQYFQSDNYDNLKNSNLSSWRLMTTERYWNQELSKLKRKESDKIDDGLKTLFEDLTSKYGNKAKELLKIIQEKKDELEDRKWLHEFLANFNTGEMQLSDEIIELLKNNPIKDWQNKMDEHYKVDDTIRDAPKIVEMIKSDSETSENIKNYIEDIGRQAKEVLQLKSSKNKRFMDFSEKEVLEWIENFKTLQYKPTVLEPLAVITRALQLKTPGKIILRDTQLMSILTMWHSNNGVLMQVSTGEGKTFIGVSFAILKALHGQKVDIITSSNILAIRDADENREFFSFFGISVDHNCHEESQRRKQAYTCQIVYGILGNFQRDYLLTEFFNENYLSGHAFDNVIVDEVDSMLLDKGNNILYLSSSLPDIDEVESVFVFIWNYVNESIRDEDAAEYMLEVKNARQTVLDNAYGTITNDDIEQMGVVEVTDIVYKLKSAGIIDNENVFKIDAYSDTKFDNALNGISTEVLQRIKIFCKNKIESEKMIKIPKYLRKFVYNHLNKWIESAKRAIDIGNENEYIIDRPTAGNEIQLDPNVIIIDLDTGTDMTNSQWDEGLHQFLQLKHGCKISQITLKSVFISNVSYFKKYNKLYGMTGTLGGLEERKKTTKMHQIDYVTVPRYVPRKFREYRPFKTSNINEWIKEIHDEVVKIFKEARSALIICETISDTKIIKKALLDDSKEFDYENVIVFQRDNENLGIGKLETGKVIIATNLAGRGTDIKLSSQLKKRGGLHVILSYLPQNARVENQAFGRASRAGDNGSGRLIMFTESEESITKMKELRNHSELRRLDEVNTYYENFITIEEEFFGKFHGAFRELKEIGNESVFLETTRKVLTTLGEIIVTAMDMSIVPTTQKRNFITDNFINNYEGFTDSRGKEMNNIYLENFKLQWSFWLDENAIFLEDWKNINAKSTVQSNFKNFLSTTPFIHPVKRIELFYENNKSGKYNEAISVLNNDYQFDSIAFQYYKCYGILKKAQIDNGYKNRQILDSEKKEIVKCIKMLNNRIHYRNVQCEIVKSLKIDFQETLVPIEAFEKQQKVLNEIDEIFVDNLQNIIGTELSPATLTTTEIKHEIMTKELYEMLLLNGCVILPKISPHFTDEDVRMVAQKNNIDFNDLQKFLNSYRGKSISSVAAFGDILKTEFKLPSREEFWTKLLEKGILTDEVEYAIIDLNALYVDPSLKEHLPNTFKDEKLTTTSNTEIFFTSITATNEDKNKFKVLMKEFRSKITNERFNYLMNNDVIEINKRAKFHLEKFKSLRNEKIFEKFDEINPKDFTNSKILERLQKSHEDDRKVLIPRDSNTYALVYENIDMLDSSSSTNIFEEDEAYREDTIKLIKQKFAYRIALESMSKKISEKISNAGENCSKIVINLHVTPHLNLLNDLLADYVIEPTRADKDKSEQLDMIKKNLKNQNVEYQKLGRSRSSVGQVKTVKFLTNNRDIMVEDFENIIKKINKSVQALYNDEIELPNVVLQPLSELATTEQQKEMLDFMKSKGFDMVIKIELKKYSATYWFRFSMVLLIAFAQIVIGAMIMVITQGALYKVGEMLIQEGIGDAIFALNSLSTGHFTWKDYGKHKLISVITTVASCGLQFALTKIKFFKNFFKSGKGINSYMTDNLKEGKSIIQLLKSGGQVAAGTRKEVFKLFTTQVGSSLGKAVTQAAISIGSDYVIREFLDSFTVKAAEQIVNVLQSESENHKVFDTIKKLLEYYSVQDAKTKIFEVFGKISEAHSFYTDICEKVSNRLDDIIRTGEGIHKAITISTSIISKLLELGSLTYFALTVYNDLNSSLNEILTKKVERETVKKEQQISDEDFKKFKKEIVEHIKKETIERFKGALNGAVVKPALSFAANAVADKAKYAFKVLREKSKEKKFRKKAAEIIESAEDGKISPKDAAEVNKILGKTKDPMLYAALTKLDIPMNSVGLEAAASVLKNLTGKDYKIEVEYEGQKYIFGNSESKEIISLDLAKGHFENSKNSQFGNNCLFDALSDKVKELGKMSPAEFRDSAAMAMVSDPKVINEIHKPHKSYFMNIGLSGGGSGQKKDLPNDEYFPLIEGKYGDVKERFEEYRRMGIAEIDHIPPKSIYSKDVHPDNMPGILIPKGLHSMMRTTGSSQSSKDFRSVLQHFMAQGDNFTTLYLNMVDYQHATIDYIKKIQQTESRQLTKELISFDIDPNNPKLFMSNVKNTLKNLIDFIENDDVFTVPKIGANILRNMVDQFDADRKFEYDFNMTIKLKATQQDIQLNKDYRKTSNTISTPKRGVGKSVKPPRKGYL